MISFSERASKGYRARLLRGRPHRSGFDPRFSEGARQLKDIVLDFYAGDRIEAGSIPCGADQWDLAVPLPPKALERAVDLSPGLQVVPIVHIDKP